MWHVGEPCKLVSRFESPEFLVRCTVMRTALFISGRVRDTGQGQEGRGTEGHRPCRGAAWWSPDGVLRGGVSATFRTSRLSSWGLLSSEEYGRWRARWESILGQAAGEASPEFSEGAAPELGGTGSTLAALCLCCQPAPGSAGERHRSLASCVSLPTCCAGQRGHPIPVGPHPS